ncbi:MAG TPA: hypothetical protein VIL30_23575 [Ramlibacter sp.]|jgi:hypothetical protein
MTRTSRVFFTAVAFAASLPLAAQPPASPPGGDASYRSAFEGYRPFASVEVRDWRQSNDTVRDIGGWRAYAREIQGAAQGPAPDASRAGSSPVAPARAADLHQGHPR